MADVITFQRFWQRRDTAANWASVNPTLASGEWGYETDTGYFKMGDGSTAWNALLYVPQIAADMPYNNVTSGLTATNVQTAIDELAAGGGGGGGVDLFAEAYEAWDFIKQGVTTSVATGTSFVTNSAVPTAYVAGAGASASLSTASGSPGIAVLTTGTTSTGYSRLFFCPPATFLGGGEVSFRARIRIPTLSDATNRFGVGVMLTNVISGTPQRIGAVYFDNINSGQWVADAIDGGGTSTTNTTVAPAANTWTVLELRANAAGTSWELFIGPDSGSLVSAGTVSANIPAVALGLSVQITKTVGSTARTVEVDLATYRKSFTTSR